MSESFGPSDNESTAKTGEQRQSPDAASPGPRNGPLRPGRRTDIDLVHTRLMEAIQTSPYYSDAFKAYEKNRLTKAWLTRLWELDPLHVAVLEHKSDVIGFMLSGPDLGKLWLYWSYVFPEKRKAGLALAALRQFLVLWDNGRYHKVATYTKPDNKVGIALLERYRFNLVCTLEKHIFGEDYLLYEHPLAKREPGYDAGIPAQGLLGRLQDSARRLFTAS